MHSATAEEWVRVSVKAGGKIPESLAMVSIQRIGELDVLCRALEDEFVAIPSAEGQVDFRLNYLMFMSELWVGAAYAISYALSARGAYKDDPTFEKLAEDLRVVRIQIEKHEIASDRKLDTPLKLRTAPAQSGPVRTFNYDEKDSLKSHIGRTGLSERCSTMWEVIDVKNGSTMRWIERRSLADRTLQSLSK